MNKKKIKKSLVLARKAIRGISTRAFSVFAMTSLCYLASFAAANDGVQAFGEIASDIAQYQEPVQKVIYAIAAVIALVGAFNIYHKMTNGDQDVKKTAMLVIGGCIALLALSSALPGMFPGAQP